jgi:hypothetical protein
MRMPPVAPGEGGDLRVTGERRWCAESSYTLEVRLLLDGGVMPVLRIPTAGSACDWTFDGMRPGAYSIVVQETDTFRVVGTVMAQIAVGAASVVTVQPADVEIEGRVTSQKALPVGLRLVFQYAGGRDLTNWWYARIDTDGMYRVMLGTPEDAPYVCVRAEADGRADAPVAHGINSFPIRCVTVSRGLQRMDFPDVEVPPAILRIEVPAVPEASYTLFADVVVDDQPGSMFKPLRGFTGQALVGYGSHTVSVVHRKSKAVFAKQVISLDPDHPSATVTLTLADLREDLP